MAKINTLVHAFNAGEVSTAALARVDNERLRLSAEIQENLYPHVVGKGQFRPGSQYLGATLTNNKARLLPFIRNTDDVAVLECTFGYLRVWEDGTSLVTRPTATSAVTNGDFSAGAGWTLTATDGATATITTYLSLQAMGRGSSALCKQTVTTSTPNVEHALRITITRGSVEFRCGSTDGGDEYVSATTLGSGVHSLAFVPTGSYYIRFTTRSEIEVTVTGCQVEAAGVLTLPAPWTEAQIPLIRYAQSADVVYIACAAWQQRKIERRGDGASFGRSWSIAYYEPLDGPFQSSSSAENIQVTPSGTQGSVTLTATGAVWSSSDVGSLFRLFTYGQNGTFRLSGADQFTPAVRITGIGADNDTSWSVNGTWVGFLYTQRSYDGPDSGFQDIAAIPAVNANGTTTVTTSAELDNVIHWLRVGFKAATYTSGSADVTFTYTGGGGYGVYKIVAFTNSSQVTAVTLIDPTSTSASSSWAKGAWSDVVGWPSSVALFDGRLFWGGEDRFWGSQSDSYSKFSLTDNTTDSGSIQRNVATGGQINTITWMMPLQRLIFGTSGAEVSARSSSFDEPLTPTNITLKDASTQGSAAISPVKLDGRGIFVQRDGVHVYELVYDFENNDYRATSLTLFNDEIGGTGIAELAIQRSPENYIWAVRDDGVAAIMLYDVKEKAAAWFKHITANTDGGVGYIESVTVLPGTSQDTVIMSIKRTINGSTVRYIERLAKHENARGGTQTYCMDCFSYSAGPTNYVLATQLINESTIVAWGTNGAGQTIPITGLECDGSGFVYLGADYTEVVVGLPYNWRYKSSKLAYGAGDGTSLLQKKRVDRIGILTEDEHPDAIRYGRDFTNVRKMRRIENGRAIGANTIRSLDSDTFPIGDLGTTWDTDARVCLSGSSPYPVTLLGLVIDIETNEDPK